jgi:hypothetical protein
MGLMALIGLSYALWTTGFRNKNHQRRLIVNTRKEVAVAPAAWTPVAPADLRSLGYLPADTNVVAAVHVAEILQDPVGRKFLQSGRPVPIEWALTRVEEWTGLKPEMLDHVVFGTKLGKDELPQLSLVVQTRLPYSQTELARAKLIHGTTPGTYRHKPFYQLRIRPVGDLLLWCADDRTLVVLYRFDGTRLEDLEAVPEAPRRGSEGLPAPLRRCLEQRVPMGTLIWLVGHLDQPDLLSPLLTMSQAPPEVQQLVSTIQTWGGGLRFEHGITLSANFHCAGDVAARELTAYLQHTTGGLGSFKIVRSPWRMADAAAWSAGATVGAAPPAGASLSAGAMLIATFGASRPDRVAEADWVTLQVRADAEAIRETLNQVSALMPRVLRP